LNELGLSACDCTFAIRCQDVETSAVLRAAFGGLLDCSAQGCDDAASSYRVDRDPSGRGYRVSGSAGAEWCDDLDSLLFHLDKHLILGLQNLRPDLYFMHAAAVARGGRVAVLSAPAGTGKSTLTLALLELGFDYLSDELAAIDLSKLAVHPYAHALCLKSPPPEPYCLPAGTIETGERFHVPVEPFAGAIHKFPLPLAAFLFLRRQHSNGDVLRSITPAVGAARLMANALNLAAHPTQGLDAAVMLGHAVPCFELETSKLDLACSAVEAILS
jgi:hypothetical protein